MTSHRITAVERRDYEKYIKHLAIKFAQVIVQSRQGVKVKTQSKLHSSGSDWFNVQIIDSEDVTIQTRRAMGNFFPGQDSLCVEIFLETPEGEKMVLETWWLRVAEPLDSVPKATIYGRMAMLLKSLLCVSRTTPAYRLSFRQGVESYIMCYYIYMGDPDLPALGEHLQQYKIGQVTTPMGTVYMSVAFRTKLTMTPSSNSDDIAIMVKSDHFDSEHSPHRGRRIIGGHPLHTPVSKLPESPLVLHSPMSGFPHSNMSDRSCDEETDDHKSEKHHNGDISHDEDSNSLDGRPRGGLFPMDLSKEFPHKEVIADIPFSALFSASKIKCEMPPLTTAPTTCITSGKQHEIHPSQNISVEKQPYLIGGKGTPEQMTISVGSEVSAEDFVMVDFKPPFAGGEAPCAEDEIGYFFRECQSAPPALLSLTNENSFPHVAELTNQLKQFEISLQDFDEFEKELFSTEGTKW